MDKGHEMILQGTVLKVERKSGQRDGRTWDFLLIHILDDVNVLACRLADAFPGPAPIEGEIGSWNVSVRAFKRGNDGAASLGIDLLSPVVSASRGE